MIKHLYWLTADLERPLALVPNPGNAYDLTGARDLLAVTRALRRLLADGAQFERNWLED
jgi:hypothetical protein